VKAAAATTALSFADVALAQGYVSKEALEEAQLLHSAARRRAPDATLADVLVRSGLLSREQAREIERRQAELLAAQAHEDLPPDVVAAMALPQNRAGRFVKLELVGRGGLGEVWRAYDPSLRRVVAIKFVHSLAPEAWQRFVKEAEILGRLQHPNIVPLHEIGDRFLVMPFIEGKTLDTAGLDARGAADAVRQAAIALDHAHRQGVVHRDVKPTNVLLAGGIVYVTDFGIAKEVRAREAMSTTGAIVGTPAYMSPEQVRGRDVDARADVYSLGATLYQLLGGRVPFASDDLFEMLRAIQEDDPPRLGAPVPRDLEAVARKAMEKSPARRYESAADMAEDLARHLRGEPVRARPSGPLGRAGRRLARYRATAALLAIAVGGVAFGLLGRGGVGGGVGGDVAPAPEPIQTVKGQQLDQPPAQTRQIDHASSNLMADMSQQEFRRGDPDKALEAANRAIELDPNNPGAYYTRGKLFWDTGRLAEARVDFARYASFGPEYAKVVEPYLSGK
jgi:tetratricopeptide (TPR) repeat protein